MAIKPPLPVLKKHPGDILDWTFIWNDRLKTGTPDADTIASVTGWVVEAGTVTVPSNSNTLVTTTAFIAGGADGETAEIECTIVTVAGRTWVAEVSVEVNEN